MACVQERVFERSADVFGSFAGNVVHNFAREMPDLECSLVLTFPVIMLGIAVDHNDRIAHRNFLKVGNEWI
jgi:hypothetical protein